MLGVLRRKRPKWLEIIGHRKEQISKCRRVGRLGLLFGLCLAVYTYSAQSKDNVHISGMYESSYILCMSVFYIDNRFCIDILYVPC